MDISMNIAVIKSDYYSALSDYGLCHGDVINEMKDLPFNKDLIDGFNVDLSPIHGKGFFTLSNINIGELICVANSDSVRTLAGRYVNHSPFSNAKIVAHGKDLCFVAKSNIKKDEEITIDYRESILLRHQKPGTTIYAATSKEGKLTLTDDRDRHEMTGIGAATYDLLFSNDHIKFLSYAERILAFEDAVSKLPQELPEVRHDFIDGMYRREVTFKKNMVATGAVHIKDHFDVMLTGEMLVATKGGFKKLVAPCCLKTKAGSKKAGIATKETIWATYHPTSTNNIKDAEQEIMISNLKEFSEGICLVQ